MVIARCFDGRSRNAPQARMMQHGAYFSSTSTSTAALLKVTSDPWDLIFGLRQSFPRVARREACFHPHLVHVAQAATWAWEPGKPSEGFEASLNACSSTSRVFLLSCCRLAAYQSMSRKLPGGVPVRPSGRLHSLLGTVPGATMDSG